MDTWPELCYSYLGYEELEASMTRRTVSIPDELARDIERIARKEKRSFSGTIADLARESIHRRTKRITFAGMGEGPADLSERAEEYLMNVVRELPD